MSSTRRRFLIRCGEVLALGDTGHHCTRCRKAHSGDRARGFTAWLAVGRAGGEPGRTTGCLGGPVAISRCRGERIPIAGRGRWRRRRQADVSDGRATYRPFTPYRSTAPRHQAYLQHEPARPQTGRRAGSGPGYPELDGDWTGWDDLRDQLHRLVARAEGQPPRPRWPGPGLALSTPPRVAV